jgi:CelD/BcsL family acetyltransferase involved in cellulose biosynthesis
MPVTRVLEEISAFTECRAAWEGLLEESPSNTVFLSHPYLAAWWEHFGGGSRFFAILVEEDGRLQAAAPLCIRTGRFLGASLRVLEIIGTGPVPTRPMGLSDRVDLPVRLGEERSLKDVFAAILGRRSEWDLVHLKGICLAESALSGVLREVLPSGGVSAHASHRYRSPYLSLEGSFEAYTRNRSRNFRKGLARHQKKLSSFGTWEVEHGENLTPEDILEAVHAVSLRSWKGSRGSGLFLNASIRRFFADLFGRFQERDWLLVRFLRSGGSRIAHEICFRYGGKLYSYDSAFDSRYASASPGEILTASILEEAFGAGLVEYDMLRGDEPYKTRWSDTMREEHEVAVTPSTLRAALYRLARIRLKAWVRGNRVLNNLDDRASALYHRLFTNRTDRTDC